jgi:hypothetical protein
MDDDPKPDHTDDPREQDVGTGGYPESSPGGTEDDDATDAQGGDGDSAAPRPSTDKEADRTASTGNPRAAG